MRLLAELLLAIWLFVSVLVLASYHYLSRRSARYLSRRRA
jgi:hypothetical protein